MSTTHLADTLDEIQDGPESHDSLPLVLIHDGGGTVFNYWMIGPLDRQVYGISDPAFESGADWDGWKGGIPQMAELYCNMIKRHVRKGSILLGGKLSLRPHLEIATGLHVNGL